MQLAKMEELTMHKRLSEFGLLKSCFEMKNPRPSCARTVLFLDNNPFLDNDPRYGYVGQGFEVCLERGRGINNIWNGEGV